MKHQFLVEVDGTTDSAEDIKSMLYRALENGLFDGGFRVDIQDS